VRDLKPWVRIVITAWVLLVVPILSLTLVMMIVGFPRLAATVWQSLRVQWADLSLRVAEADGTRTLLGLVSLVALVLPLLSVSYFLARLGRRTARRIWRASDDDPPLRVATVVAAALLAIVATLSWWPSGQYVPIAAADEPAAGTPIAAQQDLTAAAAVEPAEAGGGPARAADPALVVVEVDPATIDGELPPMPFHDFVLPDAPGPGDNQALALNRTDGTVVNVSRGSLVWVFDGVVDERNEAYALTNCRGCATQAVAFQVILVVGSAEVVSPTNVAVAINGDCAQCVANAVAQQLVLTLDRMPSDEELALLEATWARVVATLDAVGTVPIDQTIAELQELEAEIVEDLAPSLATAPRTPGDSASRDSTTTSTPTTEPPTTEDPATTTPTTTATTDGTTGTTAEPPPTTGPATPTTTTSTSTSGDTGAEQEPVTTR
jgi:putative peptide zinc metalloprotease protein